MIEGRQSPHLVGREMRQRTFMPAVYGFSLSLSLLSLLSLPLSLSLSLSLSLPHWVTHSTHGRIHITRAQTPPYKVSLPRASHAVHVVHRHRVLNGPLVQSRAPHGPRAVLVRRGRTRARGERQRLPTCNASPSATPPLSSSTTAARGLMEREAVHRHRRHRLMKRGAVQGGRKEGSVMRH